MFKGSMVAIVTPMLESGNIDWEALEKLIEWHIAEGTDAIVSVGTTGESATLTHDEHKAVMRFTVDIVKKRIPVIGGAGANSTQEAVELTLSAYHSGVDGTLQVTPYYNKPPQRGLLAHFQTVAEAAPLPVLLYNVPGRTAADLQPETVAELAKVKNIVGIKEASTYERLEALAQVFKNSDFLVLCGEDGITARALENGLIDGVVSVTANVVPKMMHEMVSAGLAGDVARLRSLNEQLAPLHKALFSEANPIPCKWALARLGRIPAGIRLPLVALAAEAQGGLEDVLRQLKLL